MIQEKNEWVQFATNDDFSNLEKAYDEELETTGYGKWLEDLESQYASEEETKTPANKEVAKIVLEEF
jgi:PAB1-binding protein PBP1